MRSRSRLLRSAKGLHMNVRTAGTVKLRRSLPRMCVSIVLAARRSAHAPRPTTGPETVVKYGFESPTDSFADESRRTSTYLTGETPTSAYWGLTLQDKSAGARCALVRGNAVSARCSIGRVADLLPGTRGKARFVPAPTRRLLLGLSLDSMYKMPSIGTVAGNFERSTSTFVARANVPGTAANTLLRSQESAAWRQYTYDLSASTAHPQLSRGRRRSAYEF